jgi:hypothetical protein
LSDSPVQHLAKKRPGGYELLSQTNLLPSETGHDGFHASLLRKL